MNFCYSPQSIKNSMYSGGLLTVGGAVLILVFLVSGFKLIPFAAVGIIMLFYAIPVMCSGFTRKAISYEVITTGLNIINVNGMKTLVKWRDITKVDDQPSSIVIYTARGKEVIYKDLEKIDDFYACLVKYLAPASAKKAAETQKKAAEKEKKESEKVESVASDEQAKESRRLLEQIMKDQSPQKLRDTKLEPQKIDKPSDAKTSSYTIDSSDIPLKAEKTSVETFKKKSRETNEDNEDKEPKKARIISMPTAISEDSAMPMPKKKIISMPPSVPEAVKARAITPAPLPVKENKGDSSWQPSEKSKLISAFLKGAMGSPKLSKQTLVITESVIANLKTPDPEEKKKELLNKYSKHFKQKEDIQEDNQDEKAQVFVSLSDIFKTSSPDKQYETRSVFVSHDEIEHNSGLLKTLDPELDIIQEDLEPDIKPAGETNRLGKLPEDIEMLLKGEIQKDNQAPPDLFKTVSEPVNSVPELSDLLDKVQTKKLSKFDLGLMKDNLALDSGKLSQDSLEFKSSGSLNRKAASEELRKKIEINTSFSEILSESKTNYESVEEKPLLNQLELTSIDKKEAPALDDLLTKLSTTGNLSLGQKAGRLNKSFKPSSSLQLPEISKPEEIQSVYQMGPHVDAQVDKEELTPSKRLSLDLEISKQKQSVPELGQLLNNFEKTTRLSFGRNKQNDKAVSDNDIIKAQSELFDRK